MREKRHKVYVIHHHFAARREDNQPSRHKIENASATLQVKGEREEMQNEIGAADPPNFVAVI